MAPRSPGTVMGLQTLCIREAKRLRRKQKNREAAERSRQKQRAEIADIKDALEERQSQLNALQIAAQARHNALEACQGALGELAEVNSLLRAQLQASGGEAPLALEQRCAAARSAASAAVQQASAV